MTDGSEIRLKFGQPVTLVGGGPRRDGDLEAALGFAPRLVCADGGANALGGREPDAIIGDMDSLREPDRWRARLGGRFAHLTEQDSTDLEKCLRCVQAPFFVGVGFLSGRVDHLLAAAHALLGAGRNAALIGDEDVVFAPGRAVSLEMEPGDRFSIFPLKPVKALRGAGLRWPVGGLSMCAGGRIGTSNEVSDSRVEIEFGGTGTDRTGSGGPGALIIVPRARLDRVVRSFG